MSEWFSANQFTIDTILLDGLLVLAFFLPFQCGQLSLAPVGFMALGAYASSLLVVKAGLPVLPAIVLAPLFAGAVGLVFGAPVLRLRGIYLALGSLALASACVVAIANLELTNGARGVAGIPIVVTTWHLVVLLAVLGTVLQLVHRSHVGRALRALRLDERTAEGVGIDAFRYKLAAFVASAGLAGLAGALEAHRTGVVSPEQYSFGLLVVVLTYAVVGGSGHWAGPLAATIGLAYLRESLELVGSFWENVVYGVLLVAVMLVAPNGLTDRALYQRFRRRAPEVAGARPRTEAEPVAAP